MLVRVQEPKTEILDSLPKKGVHMSQRSILFAACLCVPAALAQQAGSAYPPQMEGAQVEVYKTAGNVTLSIYIFNPPGHKPGDQRPAIVFFFGGGWRSGNPKQFEQQCRYLSSRGMVAMAADYRVASRHNVKAIDCVRDAKSAVRWVRQNASRLGVDPGRIAAGGGSAGGHLAAAAGLIPGLDEPGEDLKISSRPDALVLFNPALVLAPVAGFARPLVPAEARERFGAEPETISPYHHLAKGAPPTIIFHGKADTTVPYFTVELFAKKSAALGNRCELVGSEGERHGFFNYGRSGNQRYRETLTRADEFLASLGYLEGKPRVP
jgi:acetyl esterase